MADCVRDALETTSVFSDWVAKKKEDGATYIGTAQNKHYCPLWQFIHDVCPGVTDVAVLGSNITYKLPDLVGKRIVRNSWTGRFVERVDTKKGRVEIERVEAALQAVRTEVKSE